MAETWATYRQTLAGGLGFHLFTSQSSTGSASASNVVLVPELVDTNLEANFLDNVWEYQPAGTNAGEVRRVVKGGLAPGTGTITLSRAHTAATTASAGVEFYGVLPPTQHLGRRGLLQAANLALGECWTIDTLEITGNSSLYQYDLSTSFPWLVDEDQIIDVGVRIGGAVRDQLVSQWRFLADGTAPQLEFRSVFSGTDTIKVLAYRPLNTLININSTWTTSTGLSSNGDQALLTPQGMLTVGLYYCYEFLASEGDFSQRAAWRSMADRQRTKANKWKQANLPHVDGRDREAHWGNGPSIISLIGNGNVFDAGRMDL